MTNGLICCQNTQSKCCKGIAMLWTCIPSYLAQRCWNLYKLVTDECVNKERVCLSTDLEMVD